MLLLACGLAFDCGLAWIILRMLRQGRAYRTLPAFADEARPWPHVAVIVPARNEADVIGRCLLDLLGQDYPADLLAIWLVDDGSDDGTSAVAAAAANGDPRLQLIRGGDLVPGWTGKSQACFRGATAAGRADYLCFCDADTAARPALLKSAVAYASSRSLALLSLEPFQELGSPIERLLLPCGLFLIAASQDIAAINDPRSPIAAANGQFMLFKRDAYEAVGGHAAVRGEICEDTALARRVKRAGLPYELLGAERLIRTRMYRSLSTLWSGFAKNATTLGGGPLRTVLIAAGGFAFVLAGFGLAVWAGRRALAGDLGVADRGGIVLVAAGVLAGLGLHVAGTRHFGIPRVYGFLFPVGYGLALLIALDSAWCAWRGRVAWKGRSYLTAHRAPRGPQPDPARTS